MSEPRSFDEKMPEGLFDRPFALSMGPQRSGTSWLDRYLRTRGDICLPKDVKEIFFFDRHFARGPEFYKDHFSPSADEKLIMEISTTSFDHPEAPKRVYKTLGKNIKLLCPLRHPLVRSYSLYLHYLRYGIVKGSLREACFNYPQIIESSKYAKHLKHWFDFFGKENIHIVFQEDLENDQEFFIRQVCDALDIPFMLPPEKVADKYNVTTYSGSTAIAGAAQSTADWLRKHKLYSIVNTAKALGLKRIIFGKEDPDAQKKNLPAEDEAWLEEQLGDEIKKLESLTGPVSQWK